MAAEAWIKEMATRRLERMIDNVDILLERSVTGSKDEAELKSLLNDLLDEANERHDRCTRILKNKEIDYTYHY